MSSPSLVVIVPVLRRPHRVVPLMRSLFTSMTVPYDLYFVPDPTDAPEIEAIRAAGGKVLLKVAGNYAKKINTVVRATRHQHIFLGADDLHFHPGWYEAAARRLVGRVGVVGVQDMCSPRSLAGASSTHFLVLRDYVKRGTIDDVRCLLHEGYPHEYVDDEFVETAKKRGAWSFAPDSLVEHLHPDVKKAPMDSLYAAQGARMRVGRVIYEKRRVLWT